MAFKIGDRVVYEEKDTDGGCIKGEIVDIWRNTGKRITNYFVTLDSGIYIQFTTHNLKWSKLEEPALVS
jgi:ribosomal protein L35AE/L33A